MKYYKQPDLVIRAIAEGQEYLIEEDWVELSEQEVYELEQPTLSESLEKEVHNAEHLEYLKQTDWYVVRFTETGVAVPEEILYARQKARESIL